MPRRARMRRRRDEKVRAKASGRIQFGDGVNGKIPTGSISKTTYRTGGGNEGNVGAEDVSIARAELYLKTKKKKG